MTLYVNIYLRRNKMCKVKNHLPYEGRSVFYLSIYISRWIPLGVGRGNQAPNITILTSIYTKINPCYPQSHHNQRTTLPISFMFFFKYSNTLWKVISERKIKKIHEISRNIGWHFSMKTSILTNIFLYEAETSRQNMLFIRLSVYLSINMYISKFI